jgi:glycosyltransferase involved in cell wall biosynthesis
MRWAFLIGSPAISGGSYVIFQHATYARRQGIDVVIVTEDPVSRSDVAWHPDAATLTYRTYAQIADEFFNIAIATFWPTAFALNRISAKSIAYFVQSIESRFYHVEARLDRALADASYSLGIPMITEATWIQRYLRESYGGDVALVRNGIRKDIYTADGHAIRPREPGRLRVLIEGPIDVPYKNVARTIALCREAHADEVWLLTRSRPATPVPVDRVFAGVPIAETAAIYRSCDVLVKLSLVEGMFGPPLEMFHCGGTAITYDVSGHDEYLRDGENALVIRTGDEAAVVAALRRLARDRALLNRLIAGARETAAAWPDWDTSSAGFAAAIDAIVRTPVDVWVVLARAAAFKRLYDVARDDERARSSRRLRDELVDYAVKQIRSLFSRRTRRRQ